MVSSSDFSKGMIINYEKQPCQILEYTFNKPGKGGGFMKTKLRNLKTGASFEINFRTQDTFEELETENKKVTYIYHNNKEIFFNDKESNKRFSLPIDIIGDQAKFLKSNSDLEISYINDEPLTINVPIKMVYKVITAPPAVKGNTSTGASKVVVLENNLEINAPLFIKEGDSIVVNTERGEYIERYNG
jgi:elongation factor P